jgi:filamentous hemagglutinin family protein
MLHAGFGYRMGHSGRFAGARLANPVSLWNTLRDRPTQNRERATDLSRKRAILISSSSLRWATGLLLAAPFFAAPACANPVDGTVTSGAAAISSPSSRQTDVDQASEYVVIDWASFNIGSGQTTQFIQPNAQAIAVNRIGGNSPSQILGTLDANGRVVLINGSGMVFGKSSQVNVGALVATTTNDTDNNLLAGKFTQAGNRNASIVNQGTINASQGGLVALVAPHVSNSGTVSAKLGTVALGGANAFTVDFAGDGLVSFAARGSSPAGVTNTGTLAGANVSLTARAAEGVATGVVSASGIIVAQGAHQQGGVIVLDAGDGGHIAVSSANLNASGANGGGSVRIGGWNQNSVTVDKASVINASAVNTGNGGTISVIASNTNFEGRAFAQGGHQSGSGGVIETSGHSLAFGGARINASSVHGADGQWLLDPYDLTVDSTAAATIDSALNSGTGVTLQTAATGTTGPGNATSGAGDIVINSALTWSTAAKLTLDAYHSIIIDAPVSVTGQGKLFLSTDNGGALSFAGGDVTFADTSGVLTINGVRYTLLASMSNMQDINDKLTGDFALANSLDASSVANWIPLGTNGAGSVRNSGRGFAGIFEGLGNTISNLIVNIGTHDDAGLFGYSSGTIENIGLIGGSVTGRADIGELAGDNIGTISNAYATGNVVGDVKSGVDIGGLVGENSGLIDDSYAAGAVSGGSVVGGFVGGNDPDGTIANSYATGNASAVGGGSAAGAVGGFAGTNAGAIMESYATGAVAGTGDYVDVGGLVGANGSSASEESASISNSYATGAVSANGTSVLVGGLAGLNEGTISGSYASGALAQKGQSGRAGGLVGENDNTVSDSYASGAVGASGLGAMAGGLAGYNAGIVDNSYATGAVAGGSYDGGLAGLNASMISDSYAMGAVTGASGADAGGLVGANSGAIGDSFAAGAVKGDGLLGGLVGINYGPEAIITSSYWDMTTSRQTVGLGSDSNDQSGNVAGLTTARFRSGLPAGFDSAVWGVSPAINGGLPYLLALPPS